MAQRLISLDAFRGATIALMVLVNSAGGLPEAYAPLLHAEWHGWTLTDTVFPSFLWIAGVSLALSLSKRLAQGASRSSMIGPILRRGLVLYLLGLFLYLLPYFDLGTARLLGVLQRIAICYVAASLIYLYTGVRGQITITMALLAAYWILMTTVPVPGYGTGRLDVEGNVAHYVDRVVLGNHNYAQTKTWDPEGLVSTLPAIATALFGVVAAQVLRLERSLTYRTALLVAIGLGLVIAGLICNTWLPINKKLWTTSFALFMAGLDYVVFAVMLLIVDAAQMHRGVRPFVILGMNAITIYMISELGEIFLSYSKLREVFYTTLYASWLDPKNASLLYSLTYVALMFGIAYAMHRREWFVKV